MMKKTLSLLLILAATATVACIDKEYDLTKIDTDITIGGQESEFRIPLATIRVGMDEISQEGADIEALFDEADMWLPSPLPTETDGYVDIVKLNAKDEAYVALLLDALEAQMLTGGEKLTQVAGLIWTNYSREFLPTLGLPAGVDEETFKAAFMTLFRSDGAVRGEAKAQARRYLTSNLRVEPVAYDIDRIGIDGDVVDMLAEGLGKAGGSLHIYGRIESALPVSLLLAEPRITPSEVVFDDIRVEAGGASVIGQTELGEADLRQIVEGVRIEIPVVLEKYYPDKGFDGDLPDQLLIELRMVKRGGLHIDL